MIRKKTIILTLLLLAVVGNLWASTSGDYPARCRVNTNLNVRSSPSKSASKLGLLHQYEYITVKYTTGYASDLWGAIDYGGKSGYVSMRYVTYIEPVVSASASVSPRSHKKSGGVKGFFAGLWKVVKWILIGFAVLLVIGLWEYIVELAVYAGFFAGAGAILFAIFGGSGGTGAIVGLAVAALMGVRLLIGRLDIDLGGIELGGFFRVLFFIGYYVISFPFYWLNQLEHFLVEPWRYLFRYDWVSDSAKPALRIVLEVLSVIMYIAITPLRLFNAIVYNILIHCVTELYDLFFEVLAPSDEKEGSGNVGRWILMFFWRLLKYPVYHGALTIIESVIWTVVDIFIPARTLYHGTNLDAGEAITGDPHRNKYRKDTSDWATGTFLASTHPDCTWAGHGVYFAINRSLSISYSQRACGSWSDPVMIACRVSMGRVVNYTLAPTRVYRQLGDGGKHGELNRFGEKHKYTTGEWYNNHCHWEYCLLDWQNCYNHPWRIRPIYVINVRTYRAQHISGGVQHWLFDKGVLKDLGVLN